MRTANAPVGLRFCVGLLFFAFVNQQRIRTNQLVSMTDHTLHTNPRHYKEEAENINGQKQEHTYQTSSAPQMISRLERTQRSTS